MPAADASVLAATRRDLKEIAKSSATVADSALAAVALAMAGEIDSPQNSATSKSLCARVLSEVLAQLRAGAPPEPKKDGLDAIAAKHTARRRGAAA